MFLYNICFGQADMGYPKWVIVFIHTMILFMTGGIKCRLDGGQDSEEKKVGTRCI